MSIIKRYRKEALSSDDVATIYVKTYFLGIPIYEERFDSSSTAVISQFVDICEDPQPTGFYDTTKIGFKPN